MTTEGSTTATGSQFLTSVADVQPLDEMWLRERDGLPEVTNTSFSYGFLSV